MSMLFDLLGSFFDPSRSLGNEEVISIEVRLEFRQSVSSPKLKGFSQNLEG